jgi:hypothetical protein
LLNVPVRGVATTASIFLSAIVSILFGHEVEPRSLFACVAFVLHLVPGFRDRSRFLSLLLTHDSLPQLKSVETDVSI